MKQWINQHTFILKRILIICGLISIFLINPKITLGATYFNNLSNGTSTPINIVHQACSAGSCDVSVYVGQFSGTISSANNLIAQFWLNSTSTYGTGVIVFLFNDSGYSSFSEEWDPVSNTLSPGLNDINLTYNGGSPQTTCTDCYLKIRYLINGSTQDVPLTGSVNGSTQWVNPGGGYGGLSSLYGLEPYMCVGNTTSDCPVLSPVVSPTINFIYPLNGSTTPDFNNYIFSTTNLTSTDQYYISVNTIIPQVTSQSSQSITSNGGQFLNYATPVGHPYFPLTFTSTSTIEIANATLYDITNFQIPDNLNNFIVATTSATFYQIINGNNPGQTTTYDYVLPFGNASSGFSAIVTPQQNPNQAPLNVSSSEACSQWNTPGSGIFDIGNGLLYAGCQILNYAIYPSTNYTTILASTTQHFQDIFPFNLYFGVVEGVQQDLQEYNVPTTTELNLNIMGMNGQYYTMFTLTSSTLVSALTTPSNTQSQATEDVNNAFLPIKMGIWITTGIVIVKLITITI